MVTIVVAYDENRVIGNQGGIPWHLPEDFKHFKRTTMGHSCIMGRKTWESIPSQFRPLPGRLNLVVTRDFRSHTTPPQATLFLPTLEEAISASKILHPKKELFIIGGAQLYRYAIEHKIADRVLASEVKGTHEGDTFFPELPMEGLELVKSSKVLEEYDQFNVVEYVL
jgi:dihydrofolate reductase